MANKLSSSEIPASSVLGGGGEEVLPVDLDLGVYIGPFLTSLYWTSSNDCVCVAVSNTCAMETVYLCVYSSNLMRKGTGRFVQE